MEGPVRIAVTSRSLFDGGAETLHFAGTGTLRPTAAGCLTALHNRVLKITVDYYQTDTFRHQVIGKGHTKSSLSDSSFLVGKGYYDRGLYHVVFT